MASWPISGYTYIILHTTSMKDCLKAQKLLDFLNWALTDPAAAKRAGDLGYSVLPDAVRTPGAGQAGPGHLQRPAGYDKISNKIRMAQ